MEGVGSGKMKQQLESTPTAVEVCLRRLHHPNVPCKWSIRCALTVLHNGRSIQWMAASLRRSFMECRLPPWSPVTRQDWFTPWALTLMDSTAHYLPVLVCMVKIPVPHKLPFAAVGMLLPGKSLSLPRIVLFIRSSSIMRNTLHT